MAQAAGGEEKAEPANAPWAGPNPGESASRAENTPPVNKGRVTLTDYSDEPSAPAMFSSKPKEVLAEPFGSAGR